MDIGFQEIILITIIGLVVIGPERLPKVARTIGLYMGRLRRMVSEVRADVEQQLHASEFKQEFKESGAMDEIQALARETQESYAQARDSFMATGGGVESAIEDTKQALDDVKQAMEETPPDAELPDLQSPGMASALNPAAKTDDDRRARLAVPPEDAGNTKEAVSINEPAVPAVTPIPMAQQSVAPRHNAEGLQRSTEGPQHGVEDNGAAGAGAQQVQAAPEQVEQEHPPSSVAQPSEAQRAG